ncbi:choice-of-anchor D domain-containing protein, partial [Mesobaculum littorinae]
MFWIGTAPASSAAVTDCPTVGSGEQIALNFTDDNCFNLDNDPTPPNTDYSEDFLLIEDQGNQSGLTNFDLYEDSTDPRILSISVDSVAIGAGGNIYTTDCSSGCEITGSHGGASIQSFTYTYSSSTDSGSIGSSAPSAPEIEITNSDSGRSVADGSTDTLTSTAAAGTPETVTYTIRNTGDAPLTLTTPTVGGNVTNQSNVTVNNLTLGATNIAPSSSTTLVVNYTPTLAGSYGFDLSLANNDADENPYNIAVSGTATGAPEIAVSSSEGGTVTDGGTDAQGSEAAGVQKTVTYTVTNSNSGTDDLTLATATSSSASNVTVDAISAPGATTVAPGGSTTFTVQYTPTLAGAFSFALSFTNDDADETPYDIAVSGTATGAPEIAVSSSEGDEVEDGGTDA